MINALSIFDAEARTDAFCFGWLELAIRLQARHAHRSFFVLFHPSARLRIAFTPEYQRDPYSGGVTVAGKSS